MQQLRIRPEQPADAQRVRAVHEAAFGSPAEAAIVEALRRAGKDRISLIAERDGAVLGHILFSPVTLAGEPGLDLLGLGPMAVLPAEQRQGIGSALVRSGLDRCRETGCDAVVVLGHPEYYPRFGFARASRYGIGCEFDVPEEAFMALELRSGSLQGRPGRIAYDEAFSRYADTSDTLER